MREFIFGVVGLSLFFVWQWGWAKEQSVKATVLYCHDGDTCRIKIADALWVNVRLSGVDAPEVHKDKRKAQNYSFAAKDFLNAQVQNKDVTFVQSDLDIYNRPIGEIYLGQENINLTLVEKGFAECYRGKSKRLDKQKYIQAEERAKKSKLGIWRDPNYLSPKDYRARKYKGKTFF